MPEFVQSERMLSITTPLGADALILTAFRGREELSRPFHFDLDLAAEAPVAPADIVGKDVSWTVQATGEKPRVFHGRVARFVAGGQAARGMRGYRAEVVPWLWFLGLTANCRIFQNKSSQEIAEALFGEFGFSDYKFQVGALPKREYCVQYRESALAFVQRLLEEDGVYYYFEHAEDKHTLVAADSTGGYADCGYDAAWYRPSGKGDGIVTGWEHGYEYVPGKWAATDYNFEKPTTSLLASTDTVAKWTGVDGYERFDYPGRYLVKGDGEDVVKVRMAEEEIPHDVVAGASGCRQFVPGGKFKLEDHDADEENAEYVLTAVQHEAVDPSAPGGGGLGQYANSFSCIPAGTLYRPPRRTPKPAVRGPQTAVVVGKAGEELFVDKYGRIKVQFHWDREGKNDEKSSCWIRVAQWIAGKQWGAFFHPRIGQEVIVEFLEGDPDRPLVTGCVYNAANMPPYALPDDATKSGFKSRSSKGGGADDFNELYFEDKKGKELIYFHAQKDFTRIVEEDDDTKVGKNQTILVTKDRTEEVAEGNDSHKVSKGHFTMEVSKGNYGLTVSKGNFTMEVGEGDYSLKVSKGKQGVYVDGDTSLEVGKGKRSVVVSKGDDTHQIKMGKRTVSIDMGDDALTIKMGNQTTKLNLGKSATEAMQAIELKVGQSSIKIDQMGVTISGFNIKIDGKLMTEMKGLMTKVSANALLQMKGAITMIG